MALIRPVDLKMIVLIPGINDDLTEMVLSVYKLRVIISPPTVKAVPADNLSISLSWIS